MDEKSRRQNPNPLVNASLFSKIFINWIQPLIKLGNKRPLNEHDLPNPCPDQETEYLTKKLEIEWSKELKKKNPSLLYAYIRVFWFQALVLNMISLFKEGLKMIEPILINGIISYFDGTSNFKSTIIYGSLLSLLIFISNLIHHPHFLAVQKLGLMLRLSSAGIIYRKVSKLKISDPDSLSSGQIINMLANDGSRIEQSILYSAYFIVGPIQIIIVIWMLVKLIDVSILGGLIIIIIAIPIQSLLGKLFDLVRRITSKKCDTRISFLNEIFNGIKIIKMYTWENSFNQIIEKLRKRELVYQSYLHAVTAFNVIIDFILPSITMFISVALFIAFTKQPILPSYIVLIMSYYSKISFNLGYMFIKTVTGFIAAKVSLKRIQDYLLKEDLIKINDYKTADKAYINIENLSTKWSKGSDDDSFSLNNLNLKVGENELISIIGPVGSGKSSFLLSLLEELNIMKGKLEVKGSVFYVSQEPWIFTSSIRQNILFGMPYEEKKFRRIIKISCLEPDLDLFKDREHTIIGEKGINLSGGQRQRICVARALYSDSQIYLFDDPLSAVDTNVGKSLFENCINSYLKSKIRILVTHQIHLLKNVPTILYLNEGEIKFKGSYQDLVKSGIDMDLIINKVENEKPLLNRFNSLINDVETSKLLDGKKIDRQMSDNSNKINPSDKNSDSTSLLNLVSSQYLSEELIRSNLVLNKEPIDKINENDENQNEITKFGLINWKTYFIYFKLGAGIFGAMITFCLYVIAQLTTVVADYWLSNWSALEDKDRLIKINQTNFYLKNDSLPESNLNFSLFEQRYYYYNIYCILVGLAFVFGIMKTVLFFKLTINSSKYLHKKMFNSVLNTRIRFFDINPIGKIINRFSKDINVIDDAIPITVNDFMIVFMQITSPICVIVYLNHWMIVPLIFILALMLYLRNFVLKSSMELKRIESANRSPVFVHVTNTINGLLIIRACKKFENLMHEFFVHSDYNSRPTLAFFDVNRWLAVRLDFMANIFTYIVIYSFIIFKDELNVNAGQVGIMLVYVTDLMGLFQWTIRQSCEVENLMTSVERILEYVSLPSENDFVKNNKKNKILGQNNWPNEGEIKFENVSFGYDSNLPNVLNDLSFTINGGEKIGIVGRTGAGKSSIIQTLFRMAEPTGKIFIDNVNIQEISLNELRSKISIIPQEPTLFIGSIRSNLDPFNQYTDKILWESLEQVQLKETIKELKNGLDTEVQKGGANLSVGQKQLICLARAIIKKSKILVIDEATANVDYKTDSLVQESIRKCFSKCTVLTIAHRLQTIIDSDRIMCLDKGRIENFDSPYKLLKDKSSIFHELVFNLEKSEAYRLVQMAKLNSLNKEDKLTEVEIENLKNEQDDSINTVSNENDALLPK